MIIRIVGRAGVVRLAVGQSSELEELRLTLVARSGAPPGFPAPQRAWLGEIIDALASASDPHAALQLVLERTVPRLSADRGAVILREGGTYTVALTHGMETAEPARLLSDTIVTDALAGRAVAVDDAGSAERYRGVPSVKVLHLRAVLCVPIVVGGQSLGALFLGRGPDKAPFGAEALDDLRVAAAIVAPVLVQLRRTPAARPTSAAVVGSSVEIVRVRQLIERIATAELSVFVHGETGTGKEVVARAIHAASNRRALPMVTLNCAAVPESLMASELFGHSAGAFTGALSDRRGIIERAHESTLFLDEVGDMPLSMQAAMLRVLESREVIRVGETKPRAVDFRLVAATHKDLEAEAEAGRFRSDLFYRLCEVTVPLAPLRSRGEDVLLLTQVFLREAEAEFGLPRIDLAVSARQALLAHPWRGNVRELKAVLRRAALLADAQTLSAGDLHLGDASGNGAAVGSETDGAGLDRTLAEARDAFIASFVRAVLERHGGDREAACAALGISVRSLYRYLSTGEQSLEPSR